MVMWKAVLASGQARGIAFVEAQTMLEAKRKSFDQFLGIIKSHIIWDIPPTFWVVWIGAEASQYHEEINEA
jgi:hypothetical protein